MNLITNVNKTISIAYFSMLKQNSDINIKM